MLLGITDIGAVEILTDTLIGVTGVDNDTVGTLLVILTDNSIHKEGLS